MRGYKVFDSEWECRGFRYEVGKIYTMEESPKCCERGFHFCTKLVDCFRYYDFNQNNKVAEIEVFGDIDYHDDDSKACTNGIRIVRELTWGEVLELVNTGTGCSGMRNSGNWNSGYCNSGNCNSGYCNSGYCNSGYRNSGNYNSGNWNSGNYNSGNWNSGNYNSGNWNSGNCNSGNWNRTNFSSGIFNTEEQKIRMFNKESDWTYRAWLNSRARAVLAGAPGACTEWIYSENMTDKEKTEHPEHETMGGYLKPKDNRSAITEWWNDLDELDRRTVKSLPNFDWNVFCECTGIDKEKGHV